MYAAVAMRDGTTRSLVLERPRQKLNVKLKPEVVVKRKGGRFEAGQLAFVGVLDGKEMAGVVLHLASMLDIFHTHTFTHTDRQQNQFATPSLRCTVESIA